MQPLRAATESPESGARDVKASQIPPQLQQHAPLHLRELVGTQRIARGDTVFPLPTASQSVDLLGLTFQDASGKAPAHSEL